MLRRRYYQKKEAFGKAKGRKKADAPVWNRTNSKRSVHRCAEDGFLTYDPHLNLSVPREACLCFSGHRSLSPQERTRLREILPQALEQYVLQGKNCFLSGGALGFDTLAAEATLEVRKKDPRVQLVLAVPCRSQSSRWSPADRLVYQNLLRGADRVCLISEDYYPGCMQKRNRFLVEHASSCLCYLRSCRGGTWYTVSYAYDMRLDIRNLALER